MVRPAGSGTDWGSYYNGRGRRHKCPPCFIKWWSIQSSISGQRPGFFIGNVKEARGGSRGFPTADDKAGGGAIEGRDIEAGVSRCSPV